MVTTPHNPEHLAAAAKLHFTGRHDIVASMLAMRQIAWRRATSESQRMDALNRNASLSATLGCTHAVEVRDGN